MNAAETYLRLALRAQAQCRATLETLAVIKNPQPVAFVRQANIANGPQQVNNAPAQPGESSRARESENQQNKLEAKVANGWNLERQTRQGKLIQRWKPWERSTGPKTAAGKARVSRNAYKGGTRRLLRRVARLLRRTKALEFVAPR